MPKLDASQVRCHVLTYKEGLLSAVAHDLKLDVTKLTVDYDPERKSIDATFDATSLSVRCAMKDGREDPGALKDKDKQDIEKNIAKDVLVTKKNKEIRFRSKSVTESRGRYEVSGTLEVKGKARDISFGFRDLGNQLEAKVRIHQPDYGVKPYSALLGTLKIKADVDVVVTIDKALVLPE